MCYKLGCVECEYPLESHQGVCVNHRGYRETTPAVEKHKGEYKGGCPENC